MNSTSSRRHYGVLKLSRTGVRRLQQDWSVVESPLRPMRLLSWMAAAVNATRRHAPDTRAAA